MTRALSPGEMIAALEPKVQGDPAAMLALARMMQGDGQAERALALCRAALALAPEDAWLAAAANGFLAGQVPDWHFRIVRDEARNAAYEAALRRAVTPQSRVLDIGSGTGILAMMAARAGAAEVVSCEMSPPVAAAAADTVARNGLAERVRVLCRHSTALDAEADMGGRADVLVSEIVSNDLLGEKVLAAHEHAVRELLEPGARVIPARGTVRVALAHDAKAMDHHLGEVAGFDLSPFNALAPRVYQIKPGEPRLTLRSAPADLFTFDFATADYCAPERSAVTCRSTGGQINGVAQWIALDLDEVTRYENRPGPGAASCWAVLFYPFAEPRETAAGELLQIAGAHDRESLTIWLEGDQ